MYAAYGTVWLYGAYGIVQCIWDCTVHMGLYNAYGTVRCIHDYIKVTPWHTRTPSPTPTPTPTEQRATQGSDIGGDTLTRCKKAVLGITLRLEIHSHVVRRLY